MTEDPNNQSIRKAAPRKLNKVHHDYHDRSNDTVEASSNKSSYHDSSSDKKTGTGTVSADQPFPVKLHYMLNDTERDGLTNVVSWQPHGRCFVVHNNKLFQELVLGNYFRQTKNASFQRQLNLYGFKRLTAGADKNGYYHEFFLRTKPELAYKIERFKVKGKGMRKAADPANEPNFYEMKFMPPNEHDAVAAPNTPSARSACSADQLGASPHGVASASTTMGDDNAGPNPVLAALSAASIQQKVAEIMARKYSQPQQASLGRSYATATAIRGLNNVSSTSGNPFGAPTLSSSVSQLTFLLALQQPAAAPAPAPPQIPPAANSTALMLAAFQSAILNLARGNVDNGTGSAGSLPGDSLWAFR